MSDTTKVAQLRATYEIKYAQAKESGRLDDPEARQDLEKVNAMLVFLELPTWEYDLDSFEPGAFLDEWWRRYNVAQRAGIPVRPWQECFDEFEKNLDQIERDLDELEEDLREIEKEMARCKEQDSDVETDEDDDSDADGTTASDNCGGISSVSKAMYEHAPPSEEMPQASTSTSSNSSPSPDITLEGLSHQSCLLCEAFTKNPNSLHTNHNIACTTLCMLEAYHARNPLRNECFVLSISNNLDAAQIPFRTLNMPDTHVFSTVMRYLSMAFGKLLDKLFESAGEVEPGQDVQHSDILAECSTSLHSGSHNQGGDTICSADGQLGGAHVHLERHPASTVIVGDSPDITGGSSDTGSSRSHEHNNLADDFEYLYDRLRQQTLLAHGATALPPHTEAWMELASVLQTRNRALEYQVNELQDTNASLIEDVQWHIEAVSKLEDALKEAQIERAAAFKEVLDLDARLTRAQDIAGSAITSPSASVDNESTESDMADSEALQSGEGIDLHIVRHWTSIGDAQRLPRVQRKSAGDEQAKYFYFFFFPRAALILLESSPRRSYQFPRGSTLYQIHRDLVRRYNRDSADDPIFQILEILGMREYLGIRLPDTVRDEVIKIGVPYLDKIPDADDDIPLVAWEVFNDANEEFNVEGWEDWYDAVQSSACPSLRPGDSNLIVQETPQKYLTTGRGT